MQPIAGCCFCCTAHGMNEPSGCRAGAQDMSRYRGCVGWVCSGSTWNPSHALADAVNPSVNQSFFLRLITRCWAVPEPRDCRRQEGKKKKKKKFYNNTNNSNKIQIPLTIRSAAAESLSTLVCTMQTYFPACFSWMLLIIKSPAESC